MFVRVRIGCLAGAITAAIAAFAGCGGSAGSSASPPRAEPVPTVAPSSPPGARLPATAGGPTSCTVYEAVYATQVIFSSRDFDVRADCRAWTGTNASEGYLWGYQPANTNAAVGSTQLCYLTDPQRRVAVRVVESTGYRFMSPAEAAHGASACGSLATIGWIKQADRRRRTAR